MQAPDVQYLPLHSVVVKEERRNLKSVMTFQLYVQMSLGCGLVLHKHTSYQMTVLKGTQLIQI